MRRRESSPICPGRAVQACFKPSRPYQACQAQTLTKRTHKTQAPPARPSPYPYLISPCIHIHRVSLSRTRTVSTSTSISFHFHIRPHNKITPMYYPYIIRPYGICAPIYMTRRNKLSTSSNKPTQYTRPRGRNPHAAPVHAHAPWHHTYTYAPSRHHGHGATITITSHGTHSSLSPQCHIASHVADQGHTTRLSQSQRRTATVPPSSS